MANVATTARIRSPVICISVREAPFALFTITLPATLPEQVSGVCTSTWIMLFMMFTISARVMGSVGRKRPSGQSVIKPRPVISPTASWA